MISVFDRLRAVSTVIIVLIGAGLSSPRPLLAEDDLAESWVIEKEQWAADPGVVESVKVRNDFGDLRVRQSEDGQVHLLASIQRHQEDPRRAEIGHRETGSEMGIEVRYRGTGTSEPDEERDSWKRRRVDVTLLIPTEVELVAETKRGLIEAKGMKSRIDLRSVWGDVVVSTHGSVTAQSERGDIDVKFESARWSGPARLETLTGSISVLLPADPDVLVKMETRGQLTTDFTLEVVHQPNTTLKTGTAVIGEPTAELYLRSDRGNLSLRRAAR